MTGKSPARSCAGSAGAAARRTAFRKRNDDVDSTNTTLLSRSLLIPRGSGRGLRCSYGMDASVPIYRRLIGPVNAMIEIWGHKFVNFKSVERICLACGYVVGRQELEESLEWIKDHEGCELWCGGSWHIFKRRLLKQKV